MFSFFKKAPPFEGKTKGQSFRLDRKKTILNSLMNQGIEVPYSCQIGSCKKCLAKVTKGKFTSLCKETNLTQEQLEQQYCLPCQSIPESDMELFFVNDNISDEVRTPATIRKIEPLSVNTSRITFATEIKVKVGQSIMLYIPQLGESRFYTVSYEENGKFSIDVTAQPQGKCSHWLCCSSNINASIELEKPSGQFGEVSPTVDHCVAIAGGSALGSILSICEEWLKNKQVKTVTVIHAVRLKNHSYDVDRMLQLRSTYSGFNFKVALSRENINSGHFIHKNAPEILREMLLPDAENKIDGKEHFLLCGSDSLLQACCHEIKSSVTEPVKLDMESFGHSQPVL